jgi:cytochrome c peroxidase
VFRAASLRNIALTAPYMHDGRFATLRAVIDHYDSGVQDSVDLDQFLRNPDRSVRRLGLSEEDKAALEAYLMTLTDQALLTDPKFASPFQ